MKETAQIGNYLFSRESILDMGVLSCRVVSCCVLSYSLCILRLLERKKELPGTTQFLFTAYFDGCGHWAVL